MAGLKSEVDILYNALVNGPAVVLTRYPTQAAGSALTASGKTTGAYKYRAAGATQVQVVAAATNTAGMWVAGTGLHTLSIAGIFVLWVGRGTIPAAILLAEVEVVRETVVVTAVGTYGHILTTQFLPYPVFVRAGVGIALDLASSNVGQDDTAVGHVVVVTGLGA